MANATPLDLTTTDIESDGTSSCNSGQRKSRGGKGPRRRGRSGRPRRRPVHRPKKQTTTKCSEHLCSTCHQMSAGCSIPMQSSISKCSRCNFDECHDCAPTVSNCPKDVTCQRETPEELKINKVMEHRSRQSAKSESAHKKRLLAASFGNPCFPFQMEGVISPSFSEMPHEQIDSKNFPHDAQPERSQSNDRKQSEPSNERKYRTGAIDPDNSNNNDDGMVEDASSSPQSTRNLYNTDRRSEFMDVTSSMGVNGFDETQAEQSFDGISNGKESRLEVNINEIDGEHVALIKAWEQRSHQLSLYQHYTDNTHDAHHGGPSHVPPSHDLIIQVGNQQFYHSSALIAYASDYLRNRMVVAHKTKEGNCQYFIDFSHHSPDEWRLVVEFLQPRSFGVRELNSENLPVVLPWFCQFGLCVLLDDIDRYLLETVVTQTDGELTLSNLLLLTRISHECGLQTTKSQARQWLRKRLLAPQRKSVRSRKKAKELEGSEVELEWDLTQLQMLSDMITNFELLRYYVWESALILYLPHDLPVQDSYNLAANPLLPYLLREGMMQVCLSQGQNLKPTSQTLHQQNYRNYYDVEDEKEEKCEDLSIAEQEHHLRQGWPSPTSSTSTATTDPVLNTSPSSASSSELCKPNKALTQKKLHILLDKIASHLDKFKNEKEVIPKTRIDTQPTSSSTASSTSLSLSSSSSSSSSSFTSLSGRAQKNEHTIILHVDPVSSQQTTDGQRYKGNDDPKQVKTISKSDPIFSAGEECTERDVDNRYSEHFSTRKHSNKPSLRPQSSTSPHQQHRRQRNEIQKQRQLRQNSSRYSDNRIKPSSPPSARRRTFEC